MLKEELVKRILILGPPGAGKSILAKTMSSALENPIIHLNQLYWNKGWIEREKEVFWSGFNFGFCIPLGDML